MVGDHVHEEPVPGEDPLGGGHQRGEQQHEVVEQVVQLLGGGHRPVLVVEVPQLAVVVFGHGLKETQQTRNQQALGENTNSHTVTLLKNVVQMLKFKIKKCRTKQHHWVYGGTRSNSKSFLSTFALHSRKLRTSRVTRGWSR